MNVESDSAHLLEWRPRIEDAIDATLGAADLAALQTHLQECAICSREYAQLAALDTLLKNALSISPALSSNFSSRVFASIDAAELARRTLDKHRAEQAFKQRMKAFAFNWRRHIGSIVAGFAALGALIAATNPLLEAMRERIGSVLEVLPSLRNSAAVLVAVVAAATSVAATSFWWLRAKER